MQEKYIKLLLKKCLDLNESNSLLVSYNALNSEFVDKLVKYAQKIGITDIYLDKKDYFAIHDFLKNHSLSEISESKKFDQAIWDEYVQKNGAFLMLESEIPNLMEDIPSEKIALVNKIRRTSKPLYRKEQLNGTIPWCIAAIPNTYWAEDIFPESENPLDDFWNCLVKICFLDKEDPIQAWENFLDDTLNHLKKLNDLKITKLYYRNSLGTNLEIALPDGCLWQSAKEGKWIVNMPSYEIFTTPDYRYTKGIVYSGRPLNYNGKMIKDFFLEFQNGQVINFDAKEGKDILEEIIKSDEKSAFLGEVALVNYDSPISQTNKVFKTTLIDENASCHLALGNGFLECISDGYSLSKEQLEQKGINLSSNHVDFMIGTKDLTIEADTIKGRIKIMENGNLII